MSSKSRPLGTKRCTKRRFKTDVDAKIAMAKIQWKDKPSRLKMEQRVYLCPSCKGYHLTSKATWVEDAA